MNSDRRDMRNPLHQIGTWLLAVLLMTVTAFAATAQVNKKVALLIGNSRYQLSEFNLRNPANDVTALNQRLNELGFTVITAQDASAPQMNSALALFEREMQGASLAVFFFAGHGVQIEGQNLFIGTDLAGTKMEDVGKAAITLRQIRESFARAKPEAGVIILDACRNNPLNLTLGKEVAPPGLARIPGAAGTLVAYATDPGNVAFDGTGDNSIFTAALLKYIGEPGLDLRLMFGRVRQDVVLSTRGAQIPWVEDAIIGEYSFNESLNARGREALVARDVRRWREVSSKVTLAPYQAYLQEFPNGMFRDFAQQRIDRLGITLASATATDLVQTAELDVTQNPEKISQALQILGFLQKSRSVADLDSLQTAAYAYRTSNGEGATLTEERLYSDAARLLIYLGGNVGQQIRVDIAALVSIDTTLEVAQTAYDELAELAKTSPEAAQVLAEVEGDMAAIRDAQVEVLAQLDQSRAYYEDLMAQANTNFSDYMTERTIGGTGQSRVLQASRGGLLGEARVFLKHVKQTGNAETQGTYQWLSDFLPSS
jgi:Caspase domain